MQSRLIVSAKLSLSTYWDCYFLQFDVHKSSLCQPPRNIRGYIKAHAGLFAGLDECICPVRECRYRHGA